MGRTASPVTPGTNPTPDANEASGDAPVSPNMGDNSATAAPDLKATVDAQAKEIAELKAMMRTIARNQVAAAVPEKVELPTMASVLESKPTIPVLTEDGWYVPPVHPTDRKVS